MAGGLTGPAGGPYARPVIHRLVHYTGRVQGVGFRACAARIAGGHDVAGTVQNLPDGRVRLAVQGSAGEVRAFLADVDRELGRHVRRKDESEGTPDPALGDPHALDAFRVLR